MPARPLANDSGRELSPSLSPDGTRVVYEWLHDGVRTLYIKATAGGAPRPIELGATLRAQGARFPSWSPRGDLIAFLSAEAPNHYRFYVVSPEGGHPKPLTAIAGVGLCWYPDGSRIAFADRTAPGEPFSIYSISIAAGERRRLTTPPPSAFGDTYCSISPDGERLAVIRHLTRGGSDIFVGDLRDASATMAPLTQGRPGMEGIAWSPDGRWLVAGSPNGLWQFPADVRRSQSPVLLTGIEGTTQYPSFSGARPDGSAMLAYGFVLNDVNVWRWVRDDQGGERVGRLPGSTAWDDLAAFAPDGDRFAFVSNRTGQIAVWTANADGSEPRQLTFHGTSAIAPQWSPDGRKIAFALQSGDNWDIYVIHADGSTSRRLTWEPSQEENPSWSRDGRWIYFRSDRSGRGQIWKVPAEGGASRPVTLGEGSQSFEAPDGRWLYFVRADNAPGLWRMPAAGGPEEFVIPDVHQYQWSMAERSIAFVVQERRRPPQIKRFDLATGAVTTLVTLPMGDVLAGFSVTRDERSILWSKSDAQLHDVMLIDPWKP